MKKSALNTYYKASQIKKNFRVEWENSWECGDVFPIYAKLLMCLL